MNVSAASASDVEKVPTTVPLAAFSATLAAEIAMSVGAEFCGGVSVLPVSIHAAPWKSAMGLFCVFCVSVTFAVPS